jgi:hypothetical protein
MKYELSALLLRALLPLELLVSVSAGAQVTAKSFAGPDGLLDQQRAAFYIAFRDKEPLSKFILPGQTVLDPVKVVDAMGDKLDDLRSKTGHEAPWTWQELDGAFPPSKTPLQTDATLPAWKKIEGVTRKKEFGRGTALESIGPIMLRKSGTDLTKSLTDSKGATLSYSENQLQTGTGALNSQGILDYPTLWNLHQGGQGRSVQMGLDLATEWNVAQVQNNPSTSVEELTFSTPLMLYLSPGAGAVNGASDINSASSRLLVIQGNPYYLTDFGFHDAIYGVQATAEFVGNLFGSRTLYLGGFQNIGPSAFQYQLRLIPQMDYSVTERGGIHTTRKQGDDWFRLGGTVSLDFRLGMQTFNALDAGVSYQLLDAVSGSGGYFYLLQAHITLWLVENVGATIQYSKGSTPVAVYSSVSPGSRPRIPKKRRRRSAISWTSSSESSRPNSSW